MNGLILKDLYNLKGSLKSIIIIIAAFAVIFIPQGEGIPYISMMVFVSASWSLATMSMDESVNWNKYALTLPLERKDIVRGKYELLLLLSIAGTAAGFIVCAVANYITGEIPLQDIALITVIIASLGIAFTSLSFPVIFKYGAEKGRILMVLLISLPMLAILAAGYVGYGFLSDLNILHITALFAAVAVAVYMASYMTSVRIYSKIDL